MASDGPPGTESLQSDLGPERIDRLKGYAEGIHDPDRGSPQQTQR